MTRAALIRTHAVSPALISGIRAAPASGLACAGSLEADAKPERHGVAHGRVEQLCGLHSQVGRDASSSAGGRVPSRIERATIAAVAGPVEIPHGPWPAQTKRPATGGTAPTNGRPSTDCGRA